MALKTDDEDIRDVKMWIENGSNGDYYINLMERDKVDHYKTRLSTRISMSGGNATTEIRLAVAALYRAMESAGLNKHPREDARDTKK